MKTHKAKVRLLQQFALGKNTGQNSGLEIEIFGKGDGKDGKLSKLGSILMGQGTFEWWTKSAKTETKTGKQEPTLSLNWSAFAALMDKQPRK